MVPGMSVIGVRSLAQVVAELRDEEVPDAPPVAPDSGATLLAWRGQERLDELDLADLLGMADARYAVEVAAAGGHHLLLSGPKGSGKTSLAERIPGILPDLDPRRVARADRDPLAGRRPRPGARACSTRPPFSAPHHDASKASLIGGGTGVGAAGRDQPGPLRRAVPRRVPAVPRRRDRGAAPAAGERRHHHRPPRRVGDPAGPRHGRAGLQPVPVRRLAARSAEHNRCTLPARPSGATTATRSPARSPTGSTSSGTCRRCSGTTSRSTSSRPESTAAVRARVEAARARQAERYAEESWRLNGQVPGPGAARPLAADQGRAAAVDDQLYDGRLSRRGATRVHRLAWTVADLRGARPARVWPRSRPRCGCGPASRCCSRDAGAGRMSARRATGSPGSRSRVRRRARRGRGCSRWSPSSAPRRCSTRPACRAPRCRPRFRGLEPPSGCWPSARAAPACGS